MNFRTIFLQTGFSSIKICLQNIHFLALSEFQLFKWHISLANAFFSATGFKQKANHNKKRWKAVLQLYQKETPTLVFSCEICETFTKTSFEKLRKTHCFSDLKHHIRVFHTLYFSSILRNSTENSEVSFYVSLGVLTTAPEGNCPPPLLRLGLLLGLGAIFLEGNYPRTVFPSVKWN